MAGVHLGQEGFAQGMNAGDDVGKVMGHAEGQDGQRFLPRGGGKPSFSDGLAGDIQPKDLVAEQEAVRGDDGLAMFQNIGDMAGEGMADAISVGDGGVGLDGVFELLPQVGGVRLVDHIPEAVALAAPVGGIQAGEFLDVLAGGLQAEIRALTENDAGPAAGEAFEAGFSAQELDEEVAPG